MSEPIPRARRGARASEKFRLTTAQLRRALLAHGQQDPRISQALERYGFPEQRREPEGLATLVRALAGQQLSVKAAATIYARVLAHLGGNVDAERLMRTRVSSLRRLGLSQRKAESLRELARAAVLGALQVEEFSRLPDQLIIEQVTAVKGFGLWSAQMYLIFSLGRPDVWPASDLGVQKGLQLLFGLDTTPGPRETERLALAHAPERSSLALLCWHLKNNATL